jgi:flagellar basal body-associated protein FliL
MDDQFTQPQTGINATTSYHNKKRIIIIAAIVIGILVLAGAGYLIWKKYHKVSRTPEETLSDLKATSAPDTSYTADKAATVNLLNTSSAGTVKTQDERMKILNSLNN